MSYEDLLKRGREKTKKGSEERRFKIPEVKKFYEGNKTILKNLGKIAKKISRNKKHLLKFFLGKLATNGELKGDRAVFTGRFSQAKLQGALEDYFNKYVRCPKCGKPDTELKKDGYTLMKCMACGAESPIC